MQFTVKEKVSGNKINNSQQAFDRLRNIGKADQESFWVLGFNSQNKELICSCCHLGGIAICGVDIKIIFKRLISVGAVSFIVAHNHPSGSPSPSEEDKAVTKKLKMGAELLDIKFLDHIIITENNYYSFSDYGNL